MECADGMSADLIPIAGRECGFDADEVHLLPDYSLDSIAAAVDEFATRPMSSVAAQSVAYTTLLGPALLRSDTPSRCVARSTHSRGPEEAYLDPNSRK